MSVRQLRAPGEIPVARAENPVVRADALLYLHVERPDHAKAVEFLRDFGLIEAGGTETQSYWRGVGPTPVIYIVSRGTQARLIGIGLSVPTAADLENLARKTGTSPAPFSGPGGGLVLHLTDPDGVDVAVHHGMEMVPALPARAPILHNAPSATVRVNATQRPPLAAPEVTKFGHTVLGSPNFPRKLRWYMDTFGLIPSDVLCLPDATPAGAFMRLDRGAVPSDHHTLFLAYGAEPMIDHAAFEVADLDAVEMGQQVLKAKGYRHAWGVGRHILGSQIFDYWRDPWGLKHEHYADGDLFDASHPTEYHAMEPSGLYQWGPDLPSDFVDAKPSLGAIMRLLWGSFRGEVALKPLLAAGRAMQAPGRPWQK